MRNITIGVIQSASDGVAAGDASIGTVSTFAFYQPQSTSIDSNSAIVTYEPTEIAVSYISAMAFVDGNIPVGVDPVDIGTVARFVAFRQTGGNAVVGTVARFVFHRQTGGNASIGTVARFVFHRQTGGNASVGTVARFVFFRNT